MNKYPYITIYGRRGCQFTERANDLCNENGLPYQLEYIDDDQVNGYKSYYRHHTFPIVTVRYPYDEEFIGGSDNLYEYIEELKETVSE